MKNKKTIILCDPSLKNFSGHHFMLTKQILDAIKTQYQVIEVWGHINADKKVVKALSCSAKFRRVFTESVYESYSSIGRYERTIRAWSSLSLKLLAKYLHFLAKFSIVKKFYENQFFGKTRQKKVIHLSEYRPAEEIWKLIKKFDVANDDILLFHTSDGRTYRSIKCLIELADALDTELPSFHLATPYCTRIMPFLRQGQPIKSVLNAIDSRGRLGSTVKLYAENPRLAEHLSVKWDKSVGVLHIPVDKYAGKKMATRHRKKISISYLGNAREEKGFLLLAKLVKIVEGDINLSQKFKFVVQATPQATGYTPMVSKAVKYLMGCDRSLVTLILQNLSENEYRKYLLKSSVVFLCYQKSNYEYRSSGILAEAISNNRVCMVTDGTYPQWASGRAGFTLDPTKDIKHQLCELSENFNSIASEAMKEGKKYRERYSIENYRKSLGFDNISGSQSVMGSEKSQINHHRDGMKSTAEYNRLRFVAMQKSD